MLQVGGGKNNMHDSLGSLLGSCGIHFARTFHSPKLLVRIRRTLSGDIPTSVAIAMHEILCIMLRTDFSFSMWCSSVTDVLAMLEHNLSSILNGIPSSAYSFI